MAVLDVGIIDESKTRYLTYALSVVHSRALPDVRDGLKPVQRRILYAMYNNLGLKPEKEHRKSAAVVGEVLARFHPHGDAACYEAMVRMAQDFSLRYPLVDGQGNFGSLDGDSAAAYRYTEARLTALALEVIGDIDDETVAERPNFDQTTNEPVVLPSRVPNLLINGASGIAVGMATAIPPHNLKEVITALQALLDDPEIPDAKLCRIVKGPDFPTACLILNTPAEIREIYSTGRGAIRMRAAHVVESGARGKHFIVINSIPYGVDKSAIVEKIADLIIAKKVPQLVDVRDESTDVVRVVLELATDASADKAMAYLFKNTPLQTNFNVNLTALAPTENPFVGKPEQLSLRRMLEYFLQFRRDVTRSKLQYEKRRLEERIHLLEGLVSVFDRLKEVIEIVRKSDGRLDAAKNLQKRFSLSELQALFIVDLRIYQLSKTSVGEIESELKEKRKRVAEIDKILKSEKALSAVISEDLARVDSTFGDLRRSKIVSEFEEEKIVEEEYIEDEEVFVIVTKDGWVKRVRSTTDPYNSRIRDGDSFLLVEKASTRDSVAFFTSQGNVFVTKVFALSATSGFGEPVQKMFRFQDGEIVIGAVTAASGEKPFVVVTSSGLGFRASIDISTETKKSGRRVAKLAADDQVAAICPAVLKDLLILSRDGYGVLLSLEDVPILTGAGKGVILQKMSRGDRVVLAQTVDKRGAIKVVTERGGEREVELKEFKVGPRARRGDKVLARHTPIVGVALGERKDQLH